MRKWALACLVALFFIFSTIGFYKGTVTESFPFSGIFYFLLALGTLIRISEFQKFVSTYINKYDTGGLKSDMRKGANYFYKSLPGRAISIFGFACLLSAFLSGRFMIYFNQTGVDSSKSVVLTSSFLFYVGFVGIVSPPIVDLLWIIGLFKRK